MTKNSTTPPTIRNLLPLVLIVVRDDDTRLMLKYLLEIWKYRVTEAVNGEQAMRSAENSPPDVILLDYKLPDIDGLTAARRMREQEFLRETIIIFITDYADPAARAAALAAGSDDVLIKPINFGELEISLEKHLRADKKSANEPIAKVL